MDILIRARAIPHSLGLYVLASASPLPPPPSSPLHSLISQALGNIAERGDTAVVSGLAGALSDDDWAVQKVIYMYTLSDDDCHAHTHVTHERDNCRAVQMALSLTLSRTLSLSVREQEGERVRARERESSLSRSRVHLAECACLLIPGWLKPLTLD